MAETPIIKAIVVLLLLGILASLASGFMGLFRSDRHQAEHNDAEDRRTVRALTVRIGLSLALFIMLVVLGSLGIIKPNG